MSPTSRSSRGPAPRGCWARATSWLLERAALLGLDRGAADPGRLWIGQRGPMGVDGITKVVLAVGRDAGVVGLRPHRLRHTYATRLREGGADPAQIQALLGHAAIESSARYFRASDAEVAKLVDRVLDRQRLHRDRPVTPLEFAFLAGLLRVTRNPNAASRHPHGGW